MGLWGGDLYTFDTLPSTNLWATENAALYRHGDVILATVQTQGYGRFQRTWVSPPGGSLTLSALLTTPPLPESVRGILPQLAALAVARLLGCYAIAAQVKWPNDVLVGGRKISGVLAETAADPTTIVLGIGINIDIATPDFDRAGLTRSATSMAEQTDAPPPAADALCSHFLRVLAQTLDAASTTPDYLTAHWPQWDLLLGREISVTTAGALLSGHYMGIAPDGRMKLHDPTGQLHVLASGDVSIDAF